MLYRAISQSIGILIMQTSSQPTIASDSDQINPTTVSLSVKGMTCAGCVQTVEQQLRQQPGVISAIVDLTAGRATVECNAGVDPIALANALTQAGFFSWPTPTEPPQSSQRWPLIGFYILAVGFNLCLTAQVLTVGLAYFYQPDWWNLHVALVRAYGGLSLVLLAWVYWLPVPKRVRHLTVGLPVLLGLQFLTIHLSAPVPLGILHPLIGFALFSASTTLVHRVWRVISPQADAAPSA